jgi:hypothetical protein
MTGCATDFSVTRMTGSGARAPDHYAQTTDSATAGCLRNPACYNTLPGEEAVIPWLSRAVEAAHTATTVAMMLEGADIKLVEQVLSDCAQKANQQVNNEDEELQGREPDREQCKKVVRMEGGKEVTRAMEPGSTRWPLTARERRSRNASRRTSAWSPPTRKTPARDCGDGLTPSR